jgi:hypothetical protein
MDNGVLMQFNEPTDAQLSSLMKEVALESKEKAARARISLDEKIAIQIIEAIERLKKLCK